MSINVSIARSVTALGPDNLSIDDGDYYGDTRATTGSVIASIIKGINNILGTVKVLFTRLGELQKTTENANLASDTAKSNAEQLQVINGQLSTNLDQLTNYGNQELNARRETIENMKRLLGEQNHSILLQKNIIETLQNEIATLKSQVTSCSTPGAYEKLNAEVKAISDGIRALGPSFQKRAAMAAA